MLSSDDSSSTNHLAIDCTTTGTLTATTTTTTSTMANSIKSPQLFSHLGYSFIWSSNSLSALNDSMLSSSSSSSLTPLLATESPPPSLSIQHQTATSSLSKLLLDASSICSPLLSVGEISAYDEGTQKLFLILK